MKTEDVIKLWVASYPTFPDSYSILRFPEQYWKQCVYKTL